MTSKNTKQKPTKENWVKDFEEKFGDWNFHHKDLLCFHDDMAKFAIKQFIRDLLAEQRKEIIQDVRNVIAEYSGIDDIKTRELLDEIKKLI